MPLRYLFGPVSRIFAEQNLARQRREGQCLTFDLEGSADIVIHPGDNWEDVCGRLPPDWRPDVLVLTLAYTTVPAALWSAPVPVVVLATDLDLLWHYYRRQLRRCELVLADAPAVEVLSREGICHARVANLSGYPMRLQDAPPPDSPRDIDILFVGNLNPAVQGERAPWLARLARLGQRHRVVIETSIFGDAYQQLLERARIVFNRSRRGEANRRAFEAIAAGALLFQEAENHELPALLCDRQECVYYTAGNLETLLSYYLEHEDERLTIASAGRAAAGQYTFENLWAGIVADIESDLAALQKRVPQRAQPQPFEDLLSRCWQALASTAEGDPSLLADLQRALQDQPEAASLHNALGLALTRIVPRQGLKKTTAEIVVEPFRRAVNVEPEHALARLNLAEALALSGHTAAAIDQARQALAVLGSTVAESSLAGQDPHFPPGYDVFRLEWERAAWHHAGDRAVEEQPKKQLLHWRLHTLLAELTGDLAHGYEAWLARPDLPAAGATLGRVLAENNHPAEALPYLRQALERNPWDRAAARALFHTLAATGAYREQQNLIEERRLLSQAAPRILEAESWFAPAGTDGMDLTSVIVLCGDTLECTRLCLESVLRQTRPPYELVLVDNGSRDGTTTYLEEIARRPGPIRVAILRNDINRGHPAACNQAAAKAHGRYLLFLDSDTIVSEGWLEGLLSVVRQHGPTVGLVGPVSNYAASPQHVEPGYTTLEHLPTFAARRRRDCAGRSLDTERLSGFCLLVHSDVFQSLGGFDERFGLGFYDDDDLCLRASQAGFRAKVALDVYLHHFGSRTFQALATDVRELLRKNQELFRAKWTTPVARPSAEGGTPESTADALPSALPVLSAAPRRRTRVSLCMIVKNEESNLPGCLKSAADLMDEVIVVDTGSSDRTKEVAARFGARVHDFVWCDSFAAARNESLRHATGDWIFWLDADDRLDDGERVKLRALLDRLEDENIAYVLKVCSQVNASGQASRLLDQVRLFRNHPYIRWRYRVHEQILPAIGQWGGQTRWTDIIIRHTGYQDPALRRRKLERNLRMQLLEEAEQPEDSFTLFNLGRTFLDLGETEKALGLFQRSLERSQPNLSIVRKLYALLAQARQQLGQPAEALAACRDGLARYPDDAELLFQESLLLRAKEDWAGTEKSLLHLLRTQPGACFDMVDTGLRSYKGRHQLALLYQHQGRLAEAEAHWRVALTERADFTPAYLGLGELFLQQCRWEDLEQAIDDLQSKSGEEEEAVLLRARGHLARKKFASARQLLEETIARSPQLLRPRVLLTHVLLVEGRDWNAAEKALREVLQLAPDHAEAKRNLDILLRKHKPAPASPA